MNKSISDLQPVFLIGAGRSGTKFLRSVLAESDEVATIPYDVGYVWRYGNESHPDDELTVDMLTPQIKKYIHKTLPKLADVKSIGKSRFLLEKSVPNTLRVNYLYKIYPNAKFIHLVRDGRAVTESAMRLWQTPPEKGYLFKKLHYFPLSNYRYAYWYLLNVIKGKLKGGRGQQIWGPRYSGIYEDLENASLSQICARQWSRCIEVACKQLASIPKNQVLTVSYESMMEGDDVICSIINFLRLEESKAVLDFFHKKLEPLNKDKWRGSLSKEDLHTFEKECASTLSKFLGDRKGYFY